ncbi:hypothetical protein CFIO01_05933 [Colletotrichum fioriniae PJ7]|uniref:Uncharacterized protein n=1 Tax=Colletotrichum fioriniae PJ7 TaxID=1445577 RepID=A0A010SM78_9PEZI|nr:hypothetical protein CFIO01_05933 [Colletotrichum fioriniae PJ7]
MAARNSEYLAALRASSEVPSLFSTISFLSPWPARTLPSPTDRFGSGPWPPTATPCNPITLFADEAGISGHEVELRWSALSEEQKAICRARSETLRRETWAQYETAPAERPAPFALPSPGERQQQARNSAGLASRGERVARVPARVGIIKGLGIFRGEHETEWQEVLKRWEALSEEQRQAYETKAATVNAAARAAFEEGRGL